ncbi:MAG TPA: universal stress protein [Ktedonobacteraceae bacterium]|jgi:nucleotide-binding universal stress UspA family protein|nr:universal stress protein [Ktedonobacteraceae bacterium]
MEHILVGVDSDFSQTTQYTLRTASEFFSQAAPQVTLVLLNVISIPQVVSTHPSFYMGSAAFTATPTSWQRAQAEELLQKSRLIPQQYGFPPDQMRTLIRAGVPAPELLKAAQEFDARLIVVGSRGNAPTQRLRRLLVGSISHAILRAAPCPVMIVTPPQQASIPVDLVAWYQRAITDYLRENPGSLSVFTPRRAAHTFTFPGKPDPGRKEIAAAALALEHLANDGVLCRHDVEGELRYVND